MKKMMASFVSILTLLLHGSSRILAFSSLDSDGIFTSNQDLVDLLSTEAQLITSLKNYIQLENNRLEKLKDYVSKYEHLYNQATTDVEQYVGNPLNSFILIKKLTSDWKMVKDLISSTRTAENFLNNLTQPSPGSSRLLKWPSDEDLSGAAVALTRLQETYKLNVHDMAIGQLNGIETGSKLSAHDCFELGRQTYNSGDGANTVRWMNQALKIYDTEEKKSVELSEIYEYLGFTYYTQGNLRKALKYTNELLLLVPDHPRAIGNKVYYEDKLKDQRTADKRKGEDGFVDDADGEVVVAEEQISSRGEEYELYKQLCRGEETNLKKDNDKLQCRYCYGYHPYLKIGPYKEEEVNLSPRLVVYHDVLSDEEIRVVKDFATPRFRRATVQNYKTGELETAQYRVSKTAWLRKDEDETIENIYRRVGMVTGLNMDTSEELQVANYGIGGHYEPHFDFARREEKNAFTSLGTGNRIATWLFYVSNVELGGATVFPALGVTLWPSKGSAAFWYNLHKNGEGDELTRHAACPVLKGTKWVSNFWIHERGQEFTRPCSMSPFE